LQALTGIYLKLTVPVLVIFAGILTCFNLYIGGAAFLVVAVLLIILRRLSLRRKGILKHYIQTLTDEMDETTRNFVADNPLPLCMVDRDGNVLWYNSKFSEIYKDAGVFHLPITELTGLELHDLALQTETTADLPLIVTREDRTYRVMASAVDAKEAGNMMLYWMDITQVEKLKTLYKDEKVCFAYVNVDNYDEILAKSPDERKSLVAGQIERAIIQWAGSLSASITRYRSGQYFVVMDQKHFETLEKDKFSILDEIREIETDADFPTSLSIGIGIGGKNLLEQDSFALAAQEMALGRGGDQAVVKKKNKFEYYGGKSQAVERTTKGKSRIMAHALRQLVDQSSGVIIMGHRNPDMDALGAALGIYRIVRNRGKEAVIVTNSYSSTMDAIYQKVRDSKNYRLATNEEALNMIDRESLLVVVDAHRAVLLECPELLEKTDKLVLIDHHRRAEDCLEQPTLSYMEPYASSTSELVAEMLQYITAETNRPIDKLEAEALLAGITVDTNNFTVKTGIRTFDAASWLRRMGADTANIRQLLRTDAESFRLRSEVLSRAVILRDRFAVSYYEEAHPEIQILSAQAADDLLTIKGVVASFVAGPSLSGQTVISARSLGQLNVQVIMEKLGGGGHLTTAGTQLNMPLEEALAALKDLINSVEITD